MLFFNASKTIAPAPVRGWPPEMTAKSVNEQRNPFPTNEDRLHCHNGGFRPLFPCVGTRVR